MARTSARTTRCCGWPAKPASTSNARDRSWPATRYADEVRAQEQFFQSRGIHSVPATIVNGQHLIAGGQPPEAFEQALRQIAANA